MDIFVNKYQKLLKSCIIFDNGCDKQWYREHNSDVQWYRETNAMIIDKMHLCRSNMTSAL